MTSNSNTNQVNGENKPIRSVCVYCGSSFGKLPNIEEVVTALANEFVKRDIRLVYGGGSLGIMGLLATTIHNAGGKVTGIIPEVMASHCERLLGETIVVPDMHTRKQLMNEKCDAFITLPGGFGTLEETLETITWSQLNIHSKPIVVFNYHGFYDALQTWIRQAWKQGFIPNAVVDIPVFVDQVDEIFAALHDYSVENKPEYFQWQKTYI